MESPDEAAAAAAALCSSGSSEDCARRGATAAATPFAKRKRTKRSRTWPAGTTTEEEEDTARCLILLAMGPARECGDEEEERAVKFSSRKLVEAEVTGARAGFYVYECRSCSKCFNSFQALGGHRASHRKPKPAADRAVVVDDRVGTSPYPEAAAAAAAGRSRVHECAICGAEFASGQALGGHMRRHRPVGPAAVAEKVQPIKNVLVLDLNLPAPADDSMAAAFAFADRLVGCHY